MKREKSFSRDRTADDSLHDVFCLNLQIEKMANQLKDFLNPKLNVLVNHLESDHGMDEKAAEVQAVLTFSQVIAAMLKTHIVLLIQIDCPKELIDLFKKEVETAWIDAELVANTPSIKPTHFSEETH